MNFSGSALFRVRMARYTLPHDEEDTWPGLRGC